MAGLTQAKGLVDALVRQPPVRVCVAVCLALAASRLLQKTTDGVQVEPVGDSADGAEDAEDGLASPASNVDFQPVLVSHQQLFTNDLGATGEWFWSDPAATSNHRPSAAATSSTTAKII